MQRHLAALKAYLRRVAGPRFLPLLATASRLTQPGTRSSADAFLLVYGTLGEKGQKSRSGYSAKIGFEGGQMPLHRRLPKRGFTNIFKKRWLEVSLTALERSFQANEEVTPELLHNRGIIKKAKHDVVVLGNGELSKPLRISAHRFTKSAREKIEKAGALQISRLRI